MLDRMQINIDKLSEADLIDLNNRIVERLRFIRQAHAHVAMLQFRIGERVSFQPNGRPRIIGIVTRYNKKSVTVISLDGASWKVSPELLQSETASPDSASDFGNVVFIPRS